MPQTSQIPVKDLQLDLRNFRTVPQPDETHSVQSFVSIDSVRFWALMESLLEADGYLPTENILVIEGKGQKRSLIVKDGNRRIAALKLILGYLPPDIVPVPASVVSKIAALAPTWKQANAQVPCAVYGASEATTVDRIVTLAHGKGEKAGRNDWSAVARARHNRDVNGGSEPALDLLEKYLAQGKNVTAHETERWAGVYPLSILEEAMKRVAPRLGGAHSGELADAYPALAERDALESLLYAIGTERIGFPAIRQSADFAAEFGIPPIVAPPKHPGTPTPVPPTYPPVTPPVSPPVTPLAPPPPTTSPRAFPLSDPRAVKRTLKGFVPRGNNRGKVATLVAEAQKLDVSKTPLAFCFLLRSMFEISAKAYCDDHSLPTTKQNGEQKFLVDLLRDVTANLTNQNKDKAVVKELHGALTELARKDGILSVTSMNQLVHNTGFSITPADVAVLFSNIFPLLAAMNR
jgi:hypothetical protein